MSLPGSHPPLTRSTLWRGGLLLCAGLLAVAAAALSVLATERHASSDGARVLPRFFFAGNGRLHMRHGHFPETLDVRYRKADGSYDPQALADVARFFRSRGDDAVAPISLRLIELLSYLQVAHRLDDMILLSGYRSPEFNNELGAAGGAVAFASLHTQGLAADLALPKQDLRRLWLKLREQQVGGVGYYASQRFLHIDVGPPRFWEEATSRVSERLSAGNARAFLRTDFDRYADLAGAEIALHSVTALPLALGKQARLEQDGTDWAELETEPVSDGFARFEGDCWVLERPAARLVFRVRAAHLRMRKSPPRTPVRAVLVWETCPPRVERTPEKLRSNPIELVVALAEQARFHQQGDSARQLADAVTVNAVSCSQSETPW